MNGFMRFIITNALMSILVMLWEIQLILRGLPEPTGLLKIIVSIFPSVIAFVAVITGYEDE